jgi:fibronectin-binding autotransporter adhesin
MPAWIFERAVRRCRISLGVFTLLVAPAFAADQTYDPSNSANVWDLATLNWNGSTAAWVNGNSAFFGNTGESVTVDGAIIFDVLTFSATGYTLADGKGSLGLRENLPSTIEVTTGTATIAETIADNPERPSALSKMGTGTLILSGNNTFSSPMWVGNGVLWATHANALGSIAGRTTVFGDGELRISGGITVAEPLSFSTHVANSTPTLRNFSDNNIYAGEITGSGTIISDSGTLNLNGDEALSGTYRISGAGDVLVTSMVVSTVTKDAFASAGTGTLTLAGASSSATVVAGAGILRLDYSSSNDSKLNDSGELRLGTLTRSVPGIGTLNTGGTLDLAGGNHTEIVRETLLAEYTAPSTISRSSGQSVLQLNTISPNKGTGLIFTGPGIATTDNAISNGILGFWARMNVAGVSTWATSAGTADSPIVPFNGYTDVPRLGGVVPTAAGNHIRILSGGTSGNVTLGGGALTQIYSLQMSATDSPATIQAAANTDVLNVGDAVRGAIWLPASASGLTIGSAPGNGTLTSAADLHLINDNIASDLIVNSVISDSGSVYLSVIKSGTGTVVLNGNNTFTRQLTVAGGGRLILTGNSPAAKGAPNFVEVHGTLQLQANAGNTTDGTSSVLPSNNFRLRDGGRLELRADSSVVFDGSAILAGTLPVLALPIGHRFTLDVGQLTGAGANNTVTFAPLGFLITNGAQLTVTGANGYRLGIGRLFSPNLGNPILNPTSAPITVGAFEAIASGGSTMLRLHGTAEGNVVSGGIGNSQTNSPSPTQTSVTKSGSSNWELQGTNTYTGSTTVQEGTLFVSGSISAVSTTTVNARGAIGAGGEVNRIGVGSIGPLILESTAAFKFDFNIAHPSLVTADLLNVDGNLSLSGTAALLLENLGFDVPLVLGTVIPLIDYAGNWNGGTFAGLPDDSEFTFGSNKFRISYNSYTNNDTMVTLITVPEPGSTGLFLAALTGLVSSRRRRVR